MNPQTRLKLASLGFAVFWIAAMWWWNRPDMAGSVILAIAGALAGVFWYFAMNWWFKRFGPQQSS